LAGAYFLVPIVLLKFAFDRFLFPAVDGETTHESRRIDVPLDTGRSILVRQYGRTDLRHCAIFFPGSTGRIARYEQTLFPNIEKLGIAVYALSYPGQDGAQGRSRMATLLKDVDSALATVKRETSCQPGSAVFIGRSMGAIVALHAAQRARPKGLLLDGVASSLTSAVEAAARRRVVTKPWAWLPLRTLLKEDFDLRSLAESLRPVPVVIFQATKDEVTPFEDARQAVLGLDNVRFFPVPQAIHSDAYLRSAAQYLGVLAELNAH
jgi:alpha-beta hydrolase superfamily lysophospholipase